MIVDHSSSAMQRANKIFKTIKDFESLFPEEFEKTSIRQCGHCNGTGFSDKSLQNQCSNCGGMGYVGFKKIYGAHVCRACNAYGCTYCNNEGVVDWVTHATGADVIVDPKRRAG